MATFVEKMMGYYPAVILGCILGLIVFVVLTVWSCVPAHGYHTLKPLPTIEHDAAAQYEAIIREASDSEFFEVQFLDGNRSCRRCEWNCTAREAATLYAAGVAKGERMSVMDQKRGCLIFNGHND